MYWQYGRLIVQVVVKTGVTIAWNKQCRCCCSVNELWRVCVSEENEEIKRGCVNQFFFLRPSNTVIAAPFRNERL